VRQLRQVISNNQPQIYKGRFKRERKIFEEMYERNLAIKLFKKIFVLTRDEKIAVCSYLEKDMDLFYSLMLEHYPKYCFARDSILTIVFAQDLGLLGKEETLWDMNLINW